MNYVYKVLRVSIVLSMLSGCTFPLYKDPIKEELANKNIDQTVVYIQNSGMICAKKYIEKELFTNKPYGVVVCHKRSGGFFCPTTLYLYMFYSLETNNITSVTKDKRDNCF